MAGPRYLTQTQRQSRSILAQPGEEALPWTYHDTITYAAGGQSGTLLAFQTPKGQAGRTIAATNFPGAGTLPSGLRFHVQWIMLYFVPGRAAGQVRGAPPTGGATRVNDMLAFGENGFLQFNVLNSSKREIAPLGRAVPDWGFQVSAALSDSSTVAANQVSDIDHARNAGRLIAMDQLLEPTVSFDITLFWPAAVALPSGVAGTIFVYMDGVLYRKKT